MYITDCGVVLRVSDYNDRDALLTVLTDHYGKLTAKARGLRRKNNPMTAPCQLFAYSEFTLFEYNSQYTINEASSRELFMNLRSDIEKLALAGYFTQTAELLAQEDLPNPELQSLLLNSLYALSHTSAADLKIKSVFEMRAACLAGYMPELVGCHVCGSRDADRFDLSAGVLECAECRSPESTGIRMPVSRPVIEAMRYICMCAPSKILSFRLEADSLEKLSGITEAYLATQLEYSSPALDFYKGLFPLSE